jgi:hypothetical protein
VIAADVSEDWASKTDSAGFDLIIFRHTLEHMLDPVGTLRKIESSLSKDGYAYIVVPNCMRISAGARMRTDFFRPVHLYYFNPTTFLKICENAGLVADIIGDENEIWGLFRKGSSTKAMKSNDLAPEISSQQQLDHMVERLAQSAKHDRKAIYKIDVRRLLPTPIIKLLRRFR